MTITVVVDPGNFSTKYAYLWKDKAYVNSFSSVIHPYKQLEEENDLVRVTYNKLDYFVGDGAKEFYAGKADTMYYGNTKKGHHEGQIRLLFSLYNIARETHTREFNLVITTPYKSMDLDKKYFIENFMGKRTATIDGEEFEFTVQNIIMAAEGLGATISADTPNCVIIDAGSMTTNVLYLINGSISRDDSVTLNGGTLNNSMFKLATNVAKKCPYIDYDYSIICTGGQAEELADSISLLGYSKVVAAKVDKHPSYLVNVYGLLIKYSKKFEAMFA